VAKTLGVPAVYVINIRAVSTRRALDATLRHVDRQHRRTLDGVLRCTVVYDLRVVSSADITAMENTMKEKYADSEIFLTNMKSSMVSNQVTSINPEDIVVNTSADADVETNNDGTAESMEIIIDLTQLVTVLGVALVILIVILLLCVCVKRICVKRKPKTKPALQTETDLEPVDNPMSFINIEMTQGKSNDQRRDQPNIKNTMMNPIKSVKSNKRWNNHVDSKTGKTYYSNGRRTTWTAKKEVLNELATGTRHKRHKTDEGKVFYEDVDRPGVTSWELPEGGKLVSSQSSRSIKKKGSGRGKKSKGLKKSSSHGDVYDGSSADKEKGKTSGAFRQSGKKRMKRLSKIMRSRDVAAASNVEIFSDGTGRKYSYTKTTQETVWLDEEVVDEEKSGLKIKICETEQSKKKPKRQLMKSFSRHDLVV
jgi:hypothetical protein